MLLILQLDPSLNLVHIFVQPTGMVKTFHVSNIYQGRNLDFKNGSGEAISKRNSTYYLINSKYFVPWKGGRGYMSSGVGPINEGPGTP